MIIYLTKKEDISLEDLESHCKLSNEEFNCDNDPEQASSTIKDNLELINAQDYSLIIIKNKKFVGSVTLILSTKKLMKRFLNKEINEEELANLSIKEIKNKKAETLYVCSSVIKKKYRRRGFSFEGFKLGIKYHLKNNPDLELFAWVFSKEGDALCNKLSLEFKKEIKKRK